MKTLRVLLLVSIALPFAACDDVPAPEEEIRFIKSAKNIPFRGSGTQDAELFRNANGALSGSFQLLGRSPTPQDPMQAGLQVASYVTSFFAIPPECSWVSHTGNSRVERKAVQPLGQDTFSVAFFLFCKGLRVEPSRLNVMVESGVIVMLNGHVPKLSAELIAAINGPRVTDFDAEVAIREDAATLPDPNAFGLKPGGPFPIVGGEFIAIPKPPYVIYIAYAESAEYRVDAVSGTVVGKAPTYKP